LSFRLNNDEIQHGDLLFRQYLVHGSQRRLGGPREILQQQRQNIRCNAVTFTQSVNLGQTMLRLNQILGSALCTRRQRQLRRLHGSLDTIEGLTRQATLSASDQAKPKDEQTDGAGRHCKAQCSTPAGPRPQERLRVATQLCFLAATHFWAQGGRRHRAQPLGEAQLRLQIWEI
jgi:hypothetical protein